ncbi:McrB family protein [Veillonella montpellierensis]|uniref:McrB family protein n=1 Tax=Veillonella montpellierensis TaxID=187328 RepID=UPI0004078CF8|nr:AAA family ATPase [Veillonella montpellierensis]
MPNKVEQFLQQAEFSAVSIENKIENTDINQLVDVVLGRSDCILFGPPGTSKTFMIDSLADRLGNNLGLFKIIQFHTGYSYEEFIEGIVPDVDKGGFKYESGVFLNFCIEAAKNEYKDKICLFVIDEINRANVTAVFGEIMYLMENKGRRSLKTSKQKIDFIIPQNVVIVGTMNTADKTLAKLDFAFRRRFRFLAVYPSDTVLHTIVSKASFAPELDLTIEEYVDCFNILNAKITRHPLLGKNLTLGHVLWIRKNDMITPYTKEDIGRIFTETIFPQIESYCGFNKEVLGALLGPKLRDKIMYGYSINCDEVIEFLSGLKNSKAVNA